MLQPWHLRSQNRVFSSFPFQVWEKIYEKPTTQSHKESPHPFTAYVLKCPRWANVIALNKTGEILLIRQYRFGTDRIELEIPGGVVESSETPLIAIQRELEEETGYRSAHWQQIGMVDANPAIQTNQCYTFLAEDITPTGHVHFDPDEDIECEFTSFNQMRSYVQNGKITNTFIIAAFYWYNLYLGVLH